MNATKNPAAVALGSIKSERKAASSRTNGKLGGRPPMEFKLIIQRIMDGDDGKNGLIERLTEFVAPYCKTETAPNDSAQTALDEWLYDSQFTGTETPQSLAQEWDSLSDD